MLIENDNFFREATWSYKSKESLQREEGRKTYSHVLIFLYVPCSMGINSPALLSYMCMGADHMPWCLESQLHSKAPGWEARGERYENEVNHWLMVPIFVRRNLTSSLWEEPKRLRGLPHPESKVRVKSWSTETESTTPSMTRWAFP